MVAVVKQEMVYKCEVCNKDYPTIKSAEKCEQSHEEKRIKQEKETMERAKIHRVLVDIRLTSETFEELQERAVNALRHHYGYDFILDIRLHKRLDSASGWIVCTYVLKKTVKKNDYYADGFFSKNRINSAYLLKDLGFKTGSGSGNGNTYSLGVTCDLDELPMIKAKTVERGIAVENCKQKIADCSNSFSEAIIKDQHYIEYKDNECNLKQSILKLQEELEDIVKEKQKYIKENYFNQYESQCCNMIAALPNLHKDVYKDPDPMDYFSFD